MQLVFANERLLTIGLRLMGYDLVIMSFMMTSVRVKENFFETLDEERRK